jgi:peptide/nickel transport system permease protein
VSLSLLLGVALGLLPASSAASSMLHHARVRRDAVVPAILVALLIDGVGRALFPNAHDTLAFAC